MNWEELTAPEFAAAVRECEGVCLVPLGCIEKHGDHLPVGQDLIQVRALAQAAADLEPVVVYPPYYYTQITCAKHVPGTIAIGQQLMFDLLEATCVEIARNGLKKIVLLNGHGGNEYFLPYFAWQMFHDRDYDFVPYVARLRDFWAGDKTPRFAALRECTVDDHGGEAETSAMLAVRPDLVKTAAIGAGTHALGRTAHVPCYTPAWWYGDFPDHYAGDGSFGTAAKGEALLADTAANVAAIVRAVKADTAAPALMAEFRARARNPLGD